MNQRTIPKRVQVGITTKCNGSCDKILGQCVRYVLNDKRLSDNYKRDYMDLDILKPLFDDYGIINIVFIGSLGDACMHPDLLDFLEYLTSNHPKTSIIISTNGSMNDEKWWNKLAKYIDRSIGSSVIFSIDGLADTHHLYRGISYDKVMYNAKSFISSGGNAVWQYIVFKHNQHQIKEAKKECERLGFSEFRPIVSFLYGRNMEKPDGIIDFREGLEKFKPGVIAACPWTKQEMIYITEAGEVFPCCNIWPHYCDIIGVGERYKKIIDIYNENKNLINLYHHSLKEILANPFFDYIYNNINDIEQCVRSCGVNQVIRNCLFTGQAEKLLR